MKEVGTEEYKKFAAAFIKSINASVLVATNKLPKKETMINQDPVKGYKNEMDKVEAQKNLPAPLICAPNNHRTLVCIEASKHSRTDFKERVARLVGGLNTGDTLKADIVTISDGKIYPGIQFFGDEPGGLEIVTPPGINRDQIIILKDAKL